MAVWGILRSLNVYRVDDDLSVYEVRGQLEVVDTATGAGDAFAVSLRQPWLTPPTRAAFATQASVTAAGYGYTLTGIVGL